MYDVSEIFATFALAVILIIFIQMYVEVSPKVKRWIYGTKKLIKFLKFLRNQKKCRKGSN
jgi:hypothetical protein